MLWRQPTRGGQYELRCGKRIGFFRFARQLAPRGDRGFVQAGEWLPFQADVHDQRSSRFNDHHARRSRDAQPMRSSDSQIILPSAMPNVRL